MSEKQCIEVSIAHQTLKLLNGGQLEKEYLVSTSKFGAGEESGSYKTPRGHHFIRAKIGDGLAINSVLVGRRFTQEIYSQLLGAQFPQRDWVLTRILWLSGCEKGKNRLGPRDSMRRYIYIHGTPDSEPMGVTASHGCIRMRNNDVLDLFDRVQVGCPVHIIET